ncbi:MAG: hypothetical protein HYR85_10840 [Planctomycetes bacterium]|nr:hypothetical protein [Planctomycetota bacterium]MBI3847289.1 hypothetical protein [Planctomycetota bacterium]
MNRSGVALLVVASLSVSATGCQSLWPNNISYHIPGEELDERLPLPEFARPAPEPPTATPSPERGALGSVGHWLGNRFLDLTDIFGVGLLVGQGAYVNARVTRSGQAGVEWAEAARLGWSGRDAGIWSQQTSGGGVGRYRVDIDEVASNSNTRDFVGEGTESDFPHRGATGIGLSAMLPVGLGVDVEIDPFLSLVDFLGGWVGLDPANDDEP